MKNRISSLKNVSSNIFLSLKLVYKTSKMYFIFNIIMNILYQLVTVFQHVYLVSYILYCIEKNRSFDLVLDVIVPLFIFIVVRLILYSWFQSYREEQLIQKITLEIKSILYKKASNLDIEYYDSPYFYNDILWLMKEAPNKILEIFKSANNLIGVIFKTIIVGGFIINQDTIGGYLVVFSIFITLFFKNKLTKKEFEYEIEKIDLDRKHDYILKVFYLNDYSKELKTSSIGSKLIKDYENTTEDKKKLAIKYKKSFLWGNVIIEFVRNTLLFDTVYLLILFYLSYVEHRFGLSTLLALYNSSRNLRDSVDQIVILIPNFFKSSLFVEKIKNFYNIRPKVEQLTDDTFLKTKDLKKIKFDDSIELRKMSFFYNNHNLILKNINLKINKGEKIAIVGRNGSGKTTLVKLLLKLYIPQEGEILFDGININNMLLSSYRQNFSVLFQDYQIYSFSISDNITLSDIEFNYKRASNLINKLGMNSETKNLEFGNFVTKEFDSSGIYFSGGELQKLAFLRVLYNDASIIVLDEPSSSLDTQAELMVNKYISSLSIEKTVVIISHRLTTTKFVDKIVYLESGNLIEVGTHKKLVSAGGKYADLYNHQSSQYY